MIEYLKGVKIAHTATGVVVSVAGVGYGIEMPPTTLSEMPENGEEVELWIFTRVREDSIRLYGFLDEGQRRAFEILLSVGGVGPKVALAILSTLSVKSLQRTIELGRTDALEIVPGIGKRTAEKLLVELKPKAGQFVGSGLSRDLAPNRPERHDVVTETEFESLSHSSLEMDLKVALVNLGFKEKEVRTAVRSVLNSGDSQDFGVCLKATLSNLRGGKADSSHSLS